MAARTRGTREGGRAALRAKAGVRSLEGVKSRHGRERETGRRVSSRCTRRGLDGAGHGMQAPPGCGAM